MDKNKDRDVWKNFSKMLALVYLHKKVPAEPDFSLLMWEFTDKPGEEARIIHMVMD